MTSQDLHKCPFCLGQGEMRRSELIERLGQAELRQEIESCLGEAAKLAPAASKGPRDFEREVHHWNPEMPMWRRSPKE